LEAAIFTNGPMMGKRHGPHWKMGRRTALVESIGWPTFGCFIGLAMSRGRAHPAIAGSVGLVTGIAVAWLRAFTNWLPCGTVRSTASGICDTRNFDNEGRRHAWFGRRGTAFDSYAIGYGELPEDVVEGAGGLILLVRDFAAASADKSSAGYDEDFAQLRQKRGVVAWGLAPVESDQTDGVLVVVGSRRATAQAAATWLSAIGVRDAAATDQRAMIMFGGEHAFVIGPPLIHRQAMQQYGFCCQ
jgi:hypothetical protein